MSNRSSKSQPAWIRVSLILAGIYNLLWGIWVIVWPNTLFDWTGALRPTYPEIWQCVGMIVGVYGIGYLIAARDVARHWPIVLVGLLGKVLGPLGFLRAAWSGALPWSWGATIIANDLIWWVPFAAGLYFAFRENTAPGSRETPRFVEALRSFYSQRGVSLMKLSEERPTLIVFLRHAGCTFCREAMSDLGKIRSELEREGVHLALIHMGKPMDATLTFPKYGLEGVHHFSDPECRLYRAFGLGRGSAQQLFGWTVFKQGFEAFRRGHGVGMLAGDGFQMPGVFVLSDGIVEKAVPASLASDRPDYLQIAKETSHRNRPSRSLPANVNLSLGETDSARESSTPSGIQTS